MLTTWSTSTPRSAAPARSHDNNGNLTDDGTYKFGYDFENRLVELRNSTTNALIASYRYDALGRRVEKAVVGGATTRYVLDGVQVVEEFDGSNVWQARYVYEDGIDQPRCMDRADIADVNGNSNTTEVLRFHYHQQALGSVTELTQPSGAVVEWVTYDVYGLPTIRNQVGTMVSQSAVGSPWLYTGREYDSESGLYFYRARTYDPGTGRFLQRDPLGFADGLGLHEYAGSRPLVLVDPSGTEDEDESERREDEKDQAKENIEKALAVILKHGPDWAKELLKNLRRRMNIYGLHGMTGAHGLCRRVPHPEGGYGYLIPIAIGGPAGKALLEKGWLGLIRTLLHELRHVYLYEKNRQPTEGSNEDKHPMVPEHGMPESPPQDDPETEEDEGKSKVDVWRDTDKKEADETVRRAEEAAAKEGGSPTPWETGKAGEGAAGVGAPSR